MFGFKITDMLQTVLSLYGLDPDCYQISSFGSGLINSTWKVSGTEASYILQRINNTVFTRPQDIADNLQLLAQYLSNAEPDYIFAAPLAAINGKYITEMAGGYFRLSPFIPNSHTVNFLTESCQAYEAARQFAKFTAVLSGFDTSQLKYPIDNFHNLSLRIAQFNEALLKADEGRKLRARYEIDQVKSMLGIVMQYELMLNNPEIPLRVIHHDTKINNVLFDSDDKGLAVIDLDTIMPGYFISDVGDMMRTYLAKASEEEQDTDTIKVREDFFAAIYAGYMQEMGKHLTAIEKDLFIYAGEFMIYMQAVRFLTDFLNGDIYYPVTHEDHNLARAKNQLKLLQEYISAKPRFMEIIRSY